MKIGPVTVLVNFASLRSAYDVTVETLLSPECKGIRTIAIIAEGIPENMTRRLLRVAREKEVTVIGNVLHSSSHWASILNNLKFNNGLWQL